jgi:hypothetical protein
MDVAEKVVTVFQEVLFQEGKSVSVKEVEAVVLKVRFDADKLKEKESDIVALLTEMPDSFKTSGGGGMSFLELCVDKNGHQWADLHQTMDMLVALGLAIGKVGFCLLPRECWMVFPGGMPYIAIDV